MTKLDLTKLVAQIIVGSGTGTIVGSIIRNNVSIETTTDKVKVASASIVIGAMAGDATCQYTNDKIDAAAAWWNARKDKKNS